MSWMHEYPRPQLQRDSFFCLNGEWTANGQRVQVPYPLQSALSGWKGDVPEHVEYEKVFSLPDGLAKPTERIRLHFGAVDQIAEVWLNGKPVMRHEGGYLPFFADITEEILPDEENRLYVRVTDELDRRLPYGKQCKKPHGMWYTPVTGIWQSVWLEAVPETCVEQLVITPNLDRVEITVVSAEKDCEIAIDGMKPLHAPTNEKVVIGIDKPRLWTPDDPQLYWFTVRAGKDCVRSYFALRTIEAKEGRILLNGKPVFLNGVLDQGYFADGIFLPGESEEYERDVLRMKALGFNLLRKHIKVEPEAFYYACDRLGMLVMQDMVNNGGYNFLLDTALPTIGLKWRPDTLHWGKAAREAFLSHSLATAGHLRNHPCIVMWTIFNEGWGQTHADDMYLRLKDEDPTRLWDATSGWFAQKLSDMQSEHVYFRNKKLRARGARPLLLSECGGYTRTIPGHLFKPDARYGYGAAETEEALTAKFAQMYRDMVLPSIADGLCGAIYTQLSDVEEEINGLYTYDRAVCKVDKKEMRAVLQEACSELEKVVRKK